jgi:signal transduction histidine kinase
MRCLLLILSMMIVRFSFCEDRKVDSLATFLLNYHSDDTVKVNALNELSRQYLWIDYHRSLQNADTALKLARQLDYSKGIATAFNLKAFCYWAFGDNDLAIEMALEASAISEKEKDRTLLGESFLLLSRAYYDLGERNKAEIYVDKAERILLQTTSWNQILNLYNWRGVMLYAVNNKKDSALYFYRKALRIGREHSVPEINFPRIISNMGECYSNPDSAFAYFDNALTLARKTNNRTAEASISGIMGQAFLKAGQNAEAESYFLASLTLARQLGLRRVIRQVYGDMVKLKLLQGKTTEAMAYMKSHYEVRDSLLNTAKARQIVELEARHEIEKKEQAISLLEKEKRIQTMWRNILIVGVLLALAFAYFIYRLQRFRAHRTKELLELQELLNDKLKETDRLKTTFFNHISHEFRTPLTLILAPLENVMKKKPSREDAENLLLIRRNANRLLELVNQLLDISKIESGKMELRIKQGNLKQLLEVIAGSFDSLAAQKQIEFVKRITIAEKTYWFDEDKIEKITSNVLSNALKFTPPGGTVTFALLPNNDESIAICISDTGPGIPKEEQTQIFAAFYQMKRSEDQAGTGLGLSLVKELLKLYNGTITLQSTVGVGSTFTIILPVMRGGFSQESLSVENEPVSSGSPMLHTDRQA